MFASATPVGALLAAGVPGATAIGAAAPGAAGTFTGVGFREVLQLAACRLLRDQFHRPRDRYLHRSGVAVEILVTVQFLIFLNPQIAKILRHGHKHLLIHLLLVDVVEVSLDAENCGGQAEYARNAEGRDQKPSSVQSGQNRRPI